MGSVTQVEPDTSPRWRVDWLTDVMLTIMLSLAAAWWRFEVYRKSGQIQPLLLLQLGTLLWILAADIALIVLMPVAIAAVFSRLRRPRIAALTLLIGIWAGMFWMAADMRVHLVTGKHLSFYLPYLTQPDVGEWAGGTDELLHAGLILCAICAAATAVIAVYRWSLRHMLLKWPARRRLTGWVIAGVLLLTLLGGRAYMPVAAAQGDSLSGALVTMQASAETALEETIAASEFGLAFSAAMEPILKDLHPRLFTPRPLPDVQPLALDDPPDVVLIILESWRWINFNPTDMPHLSALAQSGLVANHHYAASNRSEFGLFSLFYGQTPSLYDATLDRAIPPALCHIFRKWGYDSMYVSGLNHAKFQRMDEYIDHPEGFDEVVMVSKEEWFVEIADPTWPQRDRAVMSHISSRLSQPNRKPILAVAFLGATHFPYRYPPEFLLNEPVPPDTQIWAGDMKRQTHKTLLRNRYANSASFLDDEIRKLVAGLDQSRTIVIVTGDHGESIWDDGVLTHATRASEFQCRVPLIIIGPNIPQRRIDVPTHHLDVLPTLLHAVAGKQILDATEGGDLLQPDLPKRPILLTMLPPYSGPQDRALFLPEGRMLVRLMDRKPVARLLGFVNEDGAVNPAFTPPPEDASIWAQRWNEALRAWLE